MYYATQHRTFTTGPASCPVLKYLRDNSPPKVKFERRGRQYDDMWIVSVVYQGE